MIRLSKSSITSREQSAVAAVLESEFLGMGAEVENFEKQLSTYLLNTPVVCVNTGTSALQLALQAIGIGPGDEVLVPTLTYVATYQAVSATGATPVSCDVMLNTGVINLADAKERITSKTKAIIPVHYASYPGDLNAIYEFATLNHLRVIEDAAQAFGCEYQGQKIGTIGDVVCFSFDGIKNITSGEGGAVVTKDESVVSYVKDARLLGVEKDSDARYKNGRSWDFDVKVQGWRYHMSDIMASIGRAQLSRLEEEFKPKRKQLAEYYLCKLDDIDGIVLFETKLTDIVPHIMPIRVLHNKRDSVRSRLLATGIQTGIHYKPNHLLSKYMTGDSFPIAERLYGELLTLPLHVDLTLNEIDKVIDELQIAMGEEVGVV